MNKTEDPGEVDQIIASELQRLLDSPLFLRSPMLSRLLQYLVDHRLRGVRSTPKAYAIATEALGRSDDFDPAVDSYPRVMVGRLRNLLDRYYADTPWVHRLRVPQGSYEIVVQYRSPPPGARTADHGAEAEEDDVKTETADIPPPARTGRSGWFHGQDRKHAIGWGMVALLVLALALLAMWSLRDEAGRLFTRAPVAVPVLAITEPLSGNTATSRALARALDGKLRDGFRRFDLIDLRSATAPGNTAADTVDYRLDVSLVRSVEGPVDITLVLNRVADQRAIWSQLLTIDDMEAPEFAAVEPVIAQLAGDYGVIVRDQLQRQPDNFAPGYPCLAQYNRMRQMRDQADAARIVSCLRRTIAATPRDSVALAALSLVRFSVWQPQQTTPAGREAFAEARALAMRAYETGPNSSAGLFAMTRSHFYASNCDGGHAMGDAAIALNPYDADMAGYLGLFKLSCGKAAEGEALLRRSLMLDSTFPAVPAVALAFVVSQRGDQDEAQAILSHIPSPSNMEPQYMMMRAIVLARQGNIEAGRAQWRRLLTYTGQPATATPEQVLRRFMISPAVIARTAAAVRATGVADLAQ